MKENKTVGSSGKKNNQLVSKQLQRPTGARRQAPCYGKSGGQPQGKGTQKASQRNMEMHFRSKRGVEPRYGDKKQGKQPTK